MKKINHNKFSLIFFQIHLLNGDAKPYWSDFCLILEVTKK